MTSTFRRCWVWGLWGLLAALIAGQATPPPTTAPADGSPTNSVPSAGSGSGTTSAGGLVAGGGQVAIIRIEGMIYDFTLESMRRRIDRALEAGATVIVFELDTPGGMVTSALKIAKYIKADVPVPTIAWINKEAYSAGILIASACDQIVMSPASATGDCAPIAMGQELPPTERAKGLSPILAEFRDNARSNGYDYAMFHAMCVLGVQVYLVEHEDTGQKRLINQADYLIMVEGETFPKPDPSASAAEPNLYGVKPEVATDADRGSWNLIRQVHDGKTLLTVDQDRATELGLSQSKTIHTEADLRKFLNANTTARIPQSWSEDVAGWLTSPVVRAVLVLALLLGAYMEFQSPGVGLPGAVALGALVVLLGAPFLIGLAEIWPLLLFFAGFVLLMVELLVVPGFGVFGVGGIVCMFAGLVMQVVPTGGNNWFNLPPPEMMGRLNASLMWMLIASVAAMVMFYFLFRYFESVPIFSRMILRNPLPAPVTAAAVSGDEAIGGGKIKVGDIGRVLFELRPTGRAEIDGQTVDVVTPGNWVPTGQPIRVIEIHGNRIVVEVDEPGS